MMNYENGLYVCEFCHNFEGEMYELEQVVGVETTVDEVEEGVYETHYQYVSFSVCPDCALSHINGTASRLLTW